MITINTIHRHFSQGTQQTECKPLSTAKRFNFVVLHWLFLFSVLLLLAASNANADMVFDFQKKLADKGNAEAQFKVGEMYQTGRGVDKNTTVANEWFQKAASNGHAEAGYRLLYLGIQKNGLSAENKAGAKDLTSKANDGDGVAQYYLGMMYHHGVGLAQSHDKALEWYKKAELKGIQSAEQGRLEVQTAKNKAAAAAEERRKEEARKQAELEKKQQAEKAAKDKAAKEKAAADSARAAKSQAQQDAERKAQAQADAEEKEKKRQALIKARQDREKTTQEETKGKTEFEADPCTGKSARFLSTCH